MLSTVEEMEGPSACMLEQDDSPDAGVVRLRVPVFAGCSGEDTRHWDAPSLVAMIESCCSHAARFLGLSRTTRSEWEEDEEPPAEVGGGVMGAVGARLLVVLVRAEGAMMSRLIFEPALRRQA
jgi:hypothetical protein